jgi:hypothetical protein
LFTSKTGGVSVDRRFFGGDCFPDFVDDLPPDVSKISPKLSDYPRVNHQLLPSGYD